MPPLKGNIGVIIKGLTVKGKINTSAILFFKIFAFIEKNQLPKIKSNIVVLLACSLNVLFS